jgi:hypothetical protein
MEQASTDSPKDPFEVEGYPGLTTSQEEARASAINEEGKQEKYVVLPKEDLEKGFTRPLRRSYTHEKCGVSTKMALPLCETYARDPNFYGGTYCAGCGSHFPLAQFIWDEDGEIVGS